MTFAFINAMHKEHEQLVQLLSNTKEKELGPFRVVEGKYGACDVVLMESGIGKVNAAIGAAELLHNYRLNAIINTGVAGGIDPTVGVMDVVVGKSVAYHDVDCGPENKPGQVQGLPLFFPASLRLLQIATELSAQETKIHSGLICSGDQFITDPVTLQTIKQRFPEALAVDMESGALAQVCHLYHIPFLSFRIISDTPGVENHFDQYLNFWDTMADRSFSVTKALLEAVSKF